MTLNRSVTKWQKNSANSVSYHRLHSPIYVIWVQMQTAPSVRDNAKRELAARLLGLTSLCGLKIKVEHSREDGHILQCIRSQSFGYSSDTGVTSNIRSGKPHSMQQCRVLAKGPRFCINCGEPHLANYQGCATFQSPLKQAADRANSPACNQCS